MRTITKIFAMMLISICATSLTSCLGDNDDNIESNFYTKEEAASIFKTLNGNYTGKLYAEYISSSFDAKAERDSVMNMQVRVTANDSVAHLMMPVKLLANAISGNEKVKEAIAESEAQPLNFQLFLMKSSSSDYYVFLPLPQSSFKFNIFYDGETHEVEFTFASNTIFGYSTIYAQGQYEKSSNELSFIFLPYQMVLDKKTTLTLKTCPMIYTGTKL
jgi:hypothetical protein